MPREKKWKLRMTNAWIHTLHIHAKNYCNVQLQIEKRSKTCKFYFIVSYELEIYKDNNLHHCTARSKMPTHR